MFYLFKALVLILKIPKNGDFFVEANKKNFQYRIIKSFPNFPQRINDSFL
jgi:hypothetical protein